MSKLQESLCEIGSHIILSQKAAYKIRDGKICGRPPTFGDEEQAKVLHDISLGNEAQDKIKKMIESGELEESGMSPRYEEVKSLHVSCPVCGYHSEMEDDQDTYYGRERAWKNITNEIPGTDLRSCERCNFPLSK